ncbi:MAG: hypothetical protein ABIN89_12865 [Chitinophagaceae bacterium]
MKRIVILIVCLTTYFMISCNSNAVRPDALAEKAMNELEKVLHEQSLFIKVHAAEYLIWLGHNEEAKQVYLAEDSLHNKEMPYRIGIWRVLAQAEDKEENKTKWISRVFDVYADPNAPDRLHATETLAKLQQSPLAKYPGITAKTLSSENRNLNTYALWAISYSSDSALNKNRSIFLSLALEDSNQVIRKISAYILRKMGRLTAKDWELLAEKALAEPQTSTMRHSLLNTAFVTLPSAVNASTQRMGDIYKEMLKDSHLFNTGERIELALSLADKGEAADLPVLTSMLDNENISGIYEAGSKEGADVRATAAYAILKIKQRLGALAFNNKPVHQQ